MNKRIANDRISLANLIRVAQNGDRHAFSEYVSRLEQSTHSEEESELADLPDIAGLSYRKIL